MQSYIECIPCFFNQAIKTCKILQTNLNKQKDIMNKISTLIPDFDLKTTPPEMGYKIYSLIQKETNNSNPYKLIKEKSNKIACNYYPKALKIIKESNDEILKAVEIAIAGNLIDFGARQNINLEDDMKEILKIEEKQINNDFFEINKFKSQLQKSKNIVYLGDNAGEIVFDKLLIKTIKEKYPKINITFITRKKPIINDVTKKDAEFIGMNQYCNIMSSGSSAPGTILKFCSNNFLEKFNNADMIISKGQGNFEALSENNANIFFLFVAKCPVIANHINQKIGSIILKHFEVEK